MKVTLKLLIETLPFLSWMLIVYCAPIMIFSVIWRHFKRQHSIALRKIGIVAIPPYVFWVILILVDGSGKTMGNANLEPMILSCVVTFFVFGLLMARSAATSRVMTYFVPVAGSVVAFLLWLLVPGMPE